MKKVNKNIKRTNRWKTAEFAYSGLNAEMGMPPMLRLGNPPLTNEEIIEELEEILKDCPEFYPAHLDLGLRYLILNRTKAEKILDKGFNLFIELVNKIHFEEEIEIITENLEKKWRHDLSAKYLKILLEKYPNYALLHDFLACELVDLGDIDNALKNSLKSVELKPNNHFFISNLGWVYLFADQYDNAIKYLKKAIKLDAYHNKAKGNLEIAKVLKKENITLSEYLLRKTDIKKIDDLANNEDWEEVDKLLNEYNTARIEAIKLDALSKNDCNPTVVAHLLSSLNIFFNFIGKINQDVHLNEDIDFIHDNFKPIMHKFIFKFGDIDSGIMNEIYDGLLYYFGFLSDKGVIYKKDFNKFKKYILSIKDELFEKMHRYNKIRHNDSYSEEEKEKIREELFDGDHSWEFL